MKKLLFALVLTACSQHVYSPPSQAFGISGIRPLASGQQSVDLELSQHAAMWDPAIGAGAARLRTGVGDNTEVSAEGTVLGVQDDGPSRADRTVFAARAGVRTNPGKAPYALFAGLGGGYSPAGGGFAAADAGIAIGYDNCVVVPVLQGAGMFSRPIDARPVDVTDDPDNPKMSTALPTFGLDVRAGLRVSLNHEACRRGDASSWITVGLQTTTLVDREQSNTLVGAGVGIEFPL